MNDSDDPQPSTATKPDAPSGRTELDPRTRILRATAALLAEVGWSRTTTRKVAERAGVNNALVHYYFGSKRALLLQAATDVLLAEFGGAFDAIADREELAEGVEDALNWLAHGSPADSSARVVVELTLQAVHDPALQESMRSMLRDFRDVLARKAVGQGLDEDVARGLATVLAAVLDGLYLHTLLDDELDLGAAAAALQPLFRQEDA